MTYLLSRSFDFKRYEFTALECVFQTDTHTMAHAGCFHFHFGFNEELNTYRISPHYSVHY